MRILYGANSQGQGHFSKAAVLVPLLEARGHDVRVVSSGPTPPEGYRFSWHRHFYGLPYAVSDGRTDYGLTIRRWVRDLPKLFGSFAKVRRLVQEFEPELILSDFEPLTASPLLGARCEVICISRQVALSDRAISVPDCAALDMRLTRTAVRLFTCGADRTYGYHYEPASFRCVPPVLRPEIFSARPLDGEHLLVYCHFDDARALIDWAADRRQPVRAYGFPQVPRGRQGFVEFRPPSRTGMLDDLRTARAVVTNAGLTTPIEAFLLGKPVCVTPIRNQWEQVVNAYHLHEAGLATHCETWDFDRALETPPRSVNHPLLPWLRTAPDAILDHILDERPAATRPATLPFRRAA
ncbi:glycosyltransferase family protein [Planctellipticum variicoloris]|uniref:glycosyltransferase family protein n=1 Tax=Planctellipticum variicoloris TaxID=3064265 RepID=UPI003013D252|nr:hypothetical protein SH412_002516 [Planctomycetaceae bacterium SH412]